MTSIEESIRRYATEKKACVLHKRQNVQQLICILEVLRETLRETQHNSEHDPTPTEYLFASLSTLNRHNDSNFFEMLGFISVLYTHVPSILIKNHLSTINEILSQIHRNMSTIYENNQDIASQFIMTVGSLLMGLDTSQGTWNSKEVIQTLHILMPSFLQPNPEIRFVSHKVIIKLLNHHQESNKSSVLGDHIAQFADSALASIDIQNPKNCAILLQFFDQILQFISIHSIAPIIEKLLVIPSFNNSSLTALTFDTLSHYLQVAEFNNHSEFLHEMMIALLHLSLRGNDQFGIIKFCLFIVAIMNKLNTINIDSCRELLPEVALRLINFCETENQLIQAGVCKALKMLFTETMETKFLLDIAMELRNQSSNIYVPHRVPIFLETFIHHFELLLQFKFQSSWHLTIPLLGSLFKHFSCASFPLLAGILTGLADLHDVLANVPSSSSQTVTEALQNTIGTIIRVIGPDHFCQIIPLRTLETPFNEGISEHKAWLLPILRDYVKLSVCRQPGCAPSIHHFQTYILSLTRHCRQIIQSDSVTPNDAKIQKIRVIQLWSLLPSYFYHPIDLVTAFEPFAEILAAAMSDPEFPELLLVICNALQALIKGFRAREQLGHSLEGEFDVLQRTSKKFLPSLFNILTAESTSSERGSVVAKVISDYASVTSSEFLDSIFKKLLQKFLTLTKSLANASDDSSDDSVDIEMASLLTEISLALIPSLSRNSVELLYRATKPLLRLQKNVALQKRAYKIIHSLSENHPDFCLESGRLCELLNEISDSLLTCHASARHMRLKCLECIFRALNSSDDDHMKLIPTLIGEVILCLKDANIKAREAGFDVLLAMSDLYDDKTQFLQLTLTALSGTTPHMRSSAIIGVSRLIYEYKTNDEIKQIIPSLIDTFLILFQDPSREVVKSVISFLKVAFTVLPRTISGPFIGPCVKGLFSMSPGLRDKLRVNVKGFLRKFYRIFGYEMVSPYVPESDKQLLSHIRKMEERGKKRKPSSKHQTTLDGSTISTNGSSNSSKNQILNKKKANKKKSSQQSHSEFEKLLEDSSEGESGDDGEGNAQNFEIAAGRMTNKNRKPSSQKSKTHLKSSNIQMKEGTDALDLLDTNAMVQHVKMRNSRHNKNNLEQDEFIRFTEDGRLVIKEDTFKHHHNPQDEQKENGEDLTKLPTIQKKRKRGDSNADEDNDDDGHDNENTKNQQSKKKLKNNDGLKINQQFQSQKRKKQQVKLPGQEYKAKKAGGDVQKKGKLEPYAYIPLDPKMLSKKKHHTAVAVYRNVISKGKKRR